MGKPAELLIPGKKNIILRNTKIAVKGSRIANHVWSNNHAIDFENTSIIDKGTFRTRKTLEAWHTKVTPNADNNFCLLPGQYNILFNQTFMIIYFFLSHFLFKFSHCFLITHFTRRRLQFRQSKARWFLIVLARVCFLNFNYTMILSLQKIYQEYQPNKTFAK